MTETITISVVFPANTLKGTSAGNQFKEFLDAGLPDCVAILLCHYETPLRRRGNLIYSGTCEIASVVSLPRNDITTKSPGGTQGGNVGRVCQTRRFGPLGEQSLQSPYPALRNTSSDCSGSSPCNLHIRRFTPPPLAEDIHDKKCQGENGDFPRPYRMPPVV